MSGCYLAIRRAGGTSLPERCVLYIRDHCWVMWLEVSNFPSKATRKTTSHSSYVRASCVLYGGGKWMAVHFFVAMWSGGSFFVSFSKPLVRKWNWPVAELIEDLRLCQAP